MTTQLTIKTLEAIREACRTDHLETEAEALGVAIDMLKEREQHRRSWEEILAEERI